MLKIIYKRFNIEGLSPKERRHIEHEGAWELLQGELCALGISASDIQVCESGKPYLGGSSLHFNLSHSEGFCLCAISDAPVGVDVEAIHPKEPASMQRMAERMFTEHERQRLDVANCSAEVFYEIWVKKEAIVKRDGVGITGMAMVDSDEAPVHFTRIGEFALAVCTDVEDPIVWCEEPDSGSHRMSGN